MDFKKTPEDASAVGKLLTNARTCLYKSQTADFFWHRTSFIRRVFCMNSYQK